MGGDADTDMLIGDLHLISIPALREEGDFHAYHSYLDAMISIHALREEGDVYARALLQHFVNFNPRPPRGGRLRGSFRSRIARTISIHALREEGDG